MNIGPATRRNERWWRDPWNVACIVVAIFLTALVMWPIIDAGRAALDLVWRPSGDWAVLNLRVEDVGRHTPLVGPYSRFGWNHPGPLLYWLLAIPYHLFGDKPEALLTAAATLNALTIAAMSLVAWRRGRLALVSCTMAATAVLLHAMGPAMIRNPWNPFTTLLPLVLIALLAWSVVEGDAWMWPPLLFVASYELQSHIGYLPILTMIAVAIALLAWRRNSFHSLLPSGRTQRRFILGISFVVLFGCWLPVVVDQVAGTGNLGALTHYFLSPGDSPAGLSSGLHVAADQLRFPAAPWLGRTELTGADGALLGSGVIGFLLPLLAMAGSAWIAWRTRAFAALRLQTIAVAASLGGVIATSRVIGPVFDWVVRWWWVLALLWWLSIAWSLWSSLMHVVQSRGVRRFALGLLAAIATIVTLMATRPVLDANASAEPPSPSTGIVLNGFLEPTLQALDGSGPVLVITTGSVRGDYGDALRLQLERSGIEVVAEDDMVSHLGPERSLSSRKPAGILWIVSADEIRWFRNDPNMTYIAGWDPLSPSERAQFFVDELELEHQLMAAGRTDLAQALTNGGGGVDTEALGLNGVDQELLNHVESRRRKGDPVAIFRSAWPSPRR